MSDSARPATVASTEWGEPRSATITWYDPLAAAKAARELTGLQHLQAMQRGDFAPPPMAAHFGFEIVDVRAGEISFRCTPDESSYNPIGVVHGGLVCTLLDTALGCAVHSTLPVGVAWTSIEIKVNYLRPVHATSGPLIARGWVTKPGRRVAFAEGDVRDGSGATVASASSACLVMS